MNKNRLLWSSRRGILELDLVLIPFTENVFSTLEETDQLSYEQLLKEQDQNLFSWFIYHKNPIDPNLLRIVTIIRQNAGLQSI